MTTSATPISPCDEDNVGTLQSDGSVTVDFTYQVGSGDGFLYEDLFVIEEGGDWSKPHIHIPACVGPQGSTVTCRLQSGGAYSPCQPGKTYYWCIMTTFSSMVLFSPICRFSTVGGTPPPPPPEEKTNYLPLLIGGMAAVLLVLYIRQQE